MNAAANVSAALLPGTRITCDSAFTTPIGEHFAAGSTFIVETIGSVNARARSEQCGSLVWLRLHGDAPATFATATGW